MYEQKEPIINSLTLVHYRNYVLYKATSGVLCKHTVNNEQAKPSFDPVLTL